MENTDRNFLREELSKLGRFIGILDMKFSLEYLGIETYCSCYGETFYGYYLLSVLIYWKILIHYFALYNMLTMFISYSYNFCCKLNVVDQNFVPNLITSFNWNAIMLTILCCWPKFAFIPLLYITGLLWILEPEPEGKTCPVAVVEDLLTSPGYVQSESPMHWIRREMVISSDVIKQTAEATTGQRSNAMWAIVRKLRITASNFGPVLAAAKHGRFVCCVM